MLGAVTAPLAAASVHETSTGKAAYESFQPTQVALGSCNTISVL